MVVPVVDRLREQEALGTRDARIVVPSRDLRAQRPFVQPAPAPRPTGARARRGPAGAPRAGPLPSILVRRQRRLLEPLEVAPVGVHQDA